MGFSSHPGLYTVINNQGQIAGTSSAGHLLFFDGTQVIDAGNAGAARVDPFAVNDAGQVVGALHFADGFTRAFSYFNGTFTNLGTLPGYTNSRANDINDDGVVVGVSWGDGMVGHGFVYRAGAMTDIGTLGGDGTWPMAINGAGDIVGKSAIAGSVTSRAFLYQEGAMRDLGAGANTVAFDINDSGAIVGGGDSGLAGSPAAFVISAERLHQLAALTPAIVADLPDQATSINNFGVVVGVAGRPFVWSAGKMWDLEAVTDFSGTGLMGLSAGAHPAINDRGAILTQAWGGSTTSVVLLAPEASGEPGYLANLSVRAPTRQGDERTILGFVLSRGFNPGGEASGYMVLRAVGPGLRRFGVTDPVSDPRLDLFSGSTAMIGNNDWGTAATEPYTAEASAAVGAFTLADGSTDAAKLTVLPHGAYTFHTTANSGDDGVALSEAYDANRWGLLPAFSETVPPRMINGSARVFVGTGDEIGILGFVLDGDHPSKVLIRAVGPTLAVFGVSPVLADPTLRVFAGNQPVIGNDAWGSATSFPLLAETMARVGAFHLPDDSKDAALLLQMEPGVYTVHVSGADGATGVALIEVYLVRD